MFAYGGIARLISGPRTFPPAWAPPSSCNVFSGPERTGTFLSALLFWPWRGCASCPGPSNTCFFEGAALGGQGIVLLPRRAGDHGAADPHGLRDALSVGDSGRGSRGTSGALFIWTGSRPRAAYGALPVLEPLLKAVLETQYAVLAGVIRFFRESARPFRLRGAGRLVAACVVASLALAVYSVPYVDQIRSRPSPRCPITILPRRSPLSWRLGGWGMRKRFGQNFLVNPDMRRRVCRSGGDRAGFPRLGDRSPGWAP
jgi:hypothetical protein